MGLLWNTVRSKLHYCPLVAGEWAYQLVSANWMLLPRTLSLQQVMKRSRGSLEFFPVGTSIAQRYQKGHNSTENNVYARCGDHSTGRDCDVIFFPVYWPLSYIWINICQLYELYNILPINFFFIKSTWIKLCWLTPRIRLGLEDYKNSLEYVEFNLSAGHIN